MSEKTTEEVLELARQRIMERREQEQVEYAYHDAIRQEKDRPWRYAFLAILVGFVLFLVFIPGLPLDQKMYAFLHGLCSQQHNIILGGVHFPICARCSGIYISTIITLLYLWAIGRGRAGRIPTIPITIALVGLVGFMAVDGINSMLEGLGHSWQLYPSLNVLRTLSGLGTGVGMAVLLLLMLNLSLRSDVDDEQPIFATWRELGGVLLLNLLVLLAIYGNLTLLAWPLAFLAFFGMIGVIFAVNMILVSMFMGYDGSVTSLTQLAKPATVAIIPTGIMIAAFTLTRFWLEGQGLMQ
jgi:uncharacterized membrane protein